MSGPTRSIFVPHWLGDYDVRLMTNALMMRELFDALFVVLGVKAPRPTITILSVGINDSDPNYRYDGPPLAPPDPEILDQIYGWRP